MRSGMPTGRPPPPPTPPPPYSSPPPCPPVSPVVFPSVEIPTAAKIGAAQFRSSHDQQIPHLAAAPGNLYHHPHLMHATSAQHIWGACTSSLLSPSGSPLTPPWVLTGGRKASVEVYSPMKSASSTPGLRSGVSGSWPSPPTPFHTQITLPPAFHCPAPILPPSALAASSAAYHMANPMGALSGCTFLPPMPLRCGVPAAVPPPYYASAPARPNPPQTPPYPLPIPSSPSALPGNPSLCQAATDASPGLIPSLDTRSGSGSALASHLLQQRIVKTKLCVHNLRGKCSRGSACTFAHNKDELRQAPNLFKTRLCSKFTTLGTCTKGPQCRFAHGDVELRKIDGEGVSEVAECMDYGSSEEQLRFLLAGGIGNGGGGGGETDGRDSPLCGSPSSLQSMSKSHQSSNQFPPIVGVSGTATSVSDSTSPALQQPPSSVAEVTLEAVDALLILPDDARQRLLDIVFNSLGCQTTTAGGLTDNELRLVGAAIAGSSRDAALDAPNSLGAALHSPTSFSDGSTSNLSKFYVPDTSALSALSTGPILPAASDYFVPSTIPAEQSRLAVASHLTQLGADTVELVERFVEQQKAALPIEAPQGSSTSSPELIPTTLCYPVTPPCGNENAEEQRPPAATCVPYAVHSDVGRNYSSVADTDTAEMANALDELYDGTGDIAAMLASLFQCGNEAVSSQAHRDDGTIDEESASWLAESIDSKLSTDDRSSGSRRGLSKSVSRNDTDSDKNDLSPLDCSSGDWVSITQYFKELPLSVSRKNGGGRADAARVD